MKCKNKSKRTSWEDDNISEDYGGSEYSSSKKSRMDECDEGTSFAGDDGDLNDVDIRVLHTECTGRGPHLFNTKNDLKYSGSITLLSTDTVIEIRRKIKIFVEAQEENFCGQIYIVDTEPTMSTYVSNVMNRTTIFNLPLPLVAIYVRLME